jgi:hypothetical protein
MKFRNAFQVSAQGHYLDKFKLIFNFLLSNHPPENLNQNPALHHIIVVILLVLVQVLLCRWWYQAISMPGKPGSLQVGVSRVVVNSFEFRDLNKERDS